VIDIFALLFKVLYKKIKLKGKREEDKESTESGWRKRLTAAFFLYFRN